MFSLFLPIENFYQIKTAIFTKREEDFMKKKKRILTLFSQCELIRYLGGGHIPKTASIF